MNNTGMCALARLPPVISQVLFSNGRTYLFIYESKYLLSICYVPAMVTHAGVEGDMMVHTKAMSFCFWKGDAMSPK